MAVNNPPNLLLLDRDLGQPGILSPQGVALGAATVALAAAVSRMGRFVPSRDMTIRNIAFAVTTAASVDDSIDAGIFDSTGAKIVASGSAVRGVNSTGRKVVAVTATTLTAGRVYYAGIVAAAIGGTAAVVAAANRANVDSALLFGTTAPYAEFVQAGVANFNGASVTLTTGPGSVPILALLEV